MRILAVDASGPYASVAVADGARVIHEIAFDHGLTHSETLMPAVDRALTASALTCADIDLFGCVAGPGSFTGVRIGVCTVKGLASATGKPCAALDALEVLAAGVMGGHQLVCPMLDARRDQVYAAGYRVTGTTPERVIPGAALSVEEFISNLPGEGEVLFTGDGAARHFDLIEARLGARARLAPPHLLYPRAAAACHLARFAGPVDAAELMPIYFRAPQAERERAERARAKEG